MYIEKILRHKKCHGNIFHILIDSNVLKRVGYLEVFIDYEIVRLKIWRDVMIREIKESELKELLELYLNLHEDSIPEITSNLEDTWKTIILNKNYHVVVCELAGKIISSCVCVIIPNLTRNVRPYAFIENVVTHPDYRGKGYASECLKYAKEIGKKENCYKMMLMTGSKRESTLRFYKKAGYNCEDKIDRKSVV